mgnify:FL=1
MTLFDWIFVVGGLLFVAFNVLAVTRSGGPPPGSWRISAALSAAFFAFSAVTIAREGVLGFVPVHTLGLWGNQVWLDLLLAASTAFAFLAPEARARGMRPLPWFLLVAATGSIGLFAMLARVQYLRERTVVATAGAPLLGATR